MQSNLICFERERFVNFICDQEKKDKKQNIVRLTYEYHIIVEFHGAKTYKYEYLFGKQYKKNLQ